MAIDLKRSRRLASSWAFLWLFQAILPATAAAAAAEWSYTVRPGDEIWNIASKYCGSASYAERIIEFNQLANERLIRPGSRLRIPIDWLVRQPATAEIVSVRGVAALLTPEPEPARVGQQVEMGHRLKTEDGTAVVEFADGSSLAVAAESEVLFNVLTAYGDTGMVDTNLRFYRGRGASKVLRRNDGSSFRISSPAGTAAVRGTEFRVAVDADRSLTETLEGEVGFIRDTETSVPAGYGLAASPAGEIREPLLPGPVWVSSGTRFALGSEVRWQPVEGARAYRASVYLTSDALTPVQVSTTVNEVLPLENLPLASYRIAIRGISDNDLEGYESNLDVVLINPSPEPVSPTVHTTNATKLEWQSSSAGPYLVDVAHDSEFTEVAWHERVHDKSVGPALAPGKYYWRVRSETSDFGATQTLIVRPQAPQQLELSPRSLKLIASWQAVDADEFRIRISQDPTFTTSVVDMVLATPSYEAAVPNAGRYHIEITAIANGVSSEPVVGETGVYRRPWWLLGLLVIPFLF